MIFFLKKDKYFDKFTNYFVTLRILTPTPTIKTMCKKDYKPTMNEFLSYVAFRIEFFSLPTFKDKYVVYLAKEFDKNKISQKFAEENPEFSYKERILTQAEMVLVDVDTIAYDLDLPLITIIDEHKNFVINGFFVGGLKSRIFVHPYYVYIYIPIINGNNINIETLESDVKRIFNMKILKGLVQIHKTTCIVNHNLNITPEKLFKCDVLDQEAFPQIYPNEITTGRYSDSHQTDNGITQTLTRDILKGRDRENNTECLSVSITSTSTCDNFIDDNKEVGYRQLFNLALNEAARCFK